MKASDLTKTLNKMIECYGDHNVVFRDINTFDIYKVKDILIKYSKDKDGIYIITNYIYD